MIDLETMGKTYNAPIIQFGGVYFDRYTGELGEEMEHNLDLEDTVRLGTEMDANTVKWWMQQSTAARDAVMGEPITQAHLAMVMISQFLKKSRNIWSHATFDWVILSNHFKKCHVDPIHYRKAKDIRTLTDLADLDHRETKGDGVLHNALDDCKRQIEYCVKCFNILKGKNIENN